MQCPAREAPKPDRLSTSQNNRRIGVMRSHYHTTKQTVMAPSITQIEIGTNQTTEEHNRSLIGGEYY
jgi:hypothetical protein